MLKRTVLFLALVLPALGACAPGKPSAAVDTGLYTAKSAYAVAQKAAIGYATLPRCSDTVKFPCSKQAAVDKLVELDDDATAKLKQADLATAMLAVLDFSAAVNTAQMGGTP